MQTTNVHQWTLFKGLEIIGGKIFTGKYDRFWWRSCYY